MIAHDIDVVRLKTGRRSPGRVVPDALREVGQYYQLPSLQRIHTLVPSLHDNGSADIQLQIKETTHMTSVFLAIPFMKPAISSVQDRGG